MLDNEKSIAQPTFISTKKPLKRVKMKMAPAAMMSVCWIFVTDPDNRPSPCEVNATSTEMRKNDENRRSSSG